MFSANDSVYIGSVSGRVINYNPLTEKVHVLHRVSSKYWVQRVYDAGRVKKSVHPLMWDITTPFVTPKPSMLHTIFSYLGFA